MKWKIFLNLLCLLFLFSCKKEHQEEKEAVRYPVKFTLSGFTQIMQPIDNATLKTNSLNTNTATDTIPINKLFYSLGGKTNTYYSQKIVTKTSAGFGVFEENLPAGDYTVVFFGSSTNFVPNNNNLTLDPDITTGWGDTFYKKLEFTLTSAGSNQTVQMERISAQLILNIEDAIPATVSKIEIKFGDAYSVYPGTSFTEQTQYVVTKPAVTGETNTKLYANQLVTNKPVKVYISYYTTGSLPYETKTVTVTSQPNKRTLISGKLFTSNNTFNVSYDTNWNTPVTVGF